jgi:hypothetical protein
MRLETLQTLVECLLQRSQTVSYRQSAYSRWVNSADQCSEKLSGGLHHLWDSKFRIFRLELRLGSRCPEAQVDECYSVSALQEISLRDLSITIRDAIDVVRRLDKKYIWVDALYIVQDDPQDQDTQIPLMTTIYQRAILTIYAAYGEDANAGLPGVNNNRT